MAFSNSLSLSQWMFTGIVQCLFTGLFQWVVCNVSPWNLPGNKTLFVSGGSWTAREHVIVTLRQNELRRLCRPPLNQSYEPLTLTVGTMVVRRLLFSNGAHRFLRAFTGFCQGFSDYWSSNRCSKPLGISGIHYAASVVLTAAVVSACGAGGPQGVHGAWRLGGLSEANNKYIYIYIYTHTYLSLSIYLSISIYLYLYLYLYLSLSLYIYIYT